jgi:hypothetical protein
VRALWPNSHPASRPSGNRRGRSQPAGSSRRGDSDDLHPGESEAIILATELHSQALLMDDSDGTRVAATRGINVIRTPGIYRLAKGRHLIPAVGPKLDSLRSAGFWLRDEHFRVILRSLGE